MARRIVATTTAEQPDIFTGATAQSIVRQMKRTQWNGPPRKGDYMLAVRERVHQMTGTWIDVATPTRFLRGLVEAGLMTVEWNAPLH